MRVRLDHESCERPRKARKSARRQGLFSCVSCAFVTFVFQSLLIGCQSFSLLFVVQCFETLSLLGGHRCPASLPKSGVVKIGHQEDTPTSVSCQKGLPNSAFLTSPRYSSPVLLSQ